MITFLFGYIPLLAMLGFALWLLSRLLKSISSSISAPIISQEARIISRRQQTAKGITYPFATFEFKDGSRRELVILNGDYGILKEGDRGTVRYKGRFYKGFVRSAKPSSTPQYVNTTNRQTTTYTQNQSTDHQQNQDKLQLGLQRLSKAGSDPDMLGLALISLHGALEDYFRNWLSTNSSVSHSEREAVLDTAQVQWKGLLNLMQQYGGLDNNQRQYIFRMNRLRQDVGHGNQFAGTRSELENYADFVRDFLANGSSSTDNSENRNNDSGQKGDDLSIDLKLSPHEAASGIEKQIKFYNLNECDTCNSKGFTQLGDSCSVCNATGRIEKNQKLQVTVPAGISNGTRLRVAGKGDVGIRGVSPGDLYLYIYIESE